MHVIARHGDLIGVSETLFETTCTAPDIPIGTDRLSR